ncbi:unnamed protein product [Closterium sp. Yama58-4]|nr:unnamed protein product [Closterium sp. Yama58-4]
MEGVFVLDFESPTTSSDNEHILVLDLPSHPSPPRWSHPEETDYQRPGLDDTFRALAVPLASTTNPAHTGLQAVEEGEEGTSETAVATTKATDKKIAQPIWPPAPQPTGWNTTEGWDAVDVRWVMENTVLGEAIAAETRWGNVAGEAVAAETRRGNVVGEPAAEELGTVEIPEVNEEAPEAEEEESLTEYGPHLIPIMTDSRDYLRLETRGVAIGNADSEEVMLPEYRHSQTTSTTPEGPPELPVTIDTIIIGDTSGTYNGATL